MQQPDQELVCISTTSNIYSFLTELFLREASFPVAIYCQVMYLSVGGLIFISLSYSAYTTECPGTRLQLSMWPGVIGLGSALAQLRSTAAYGVTLGNVLKLCALVSSSVKWTE